MKNKSEVAKKIKRKLRAFGVKVKFSTYSIDKFKDVAHDMEKILASNNKESKNENQSK